MAKNQYTYAVARIRAMEVSLFSQAVIDQLLACKDEKQCLLLLQEKDGEMRIPRSMQKRFYHVNVKRHGKRSKALRMIRRCLT